MQINKQLLKGKQERLEACKIYLKKEFVGIDYIIDSLLDYIQVWYLMPEILNRPIIINLWGMTGVGKTDLIRKMVKYIDYQDRFVEIELSNIDQSNWKSSVFSIFQENEINDENPSIVLFDEIQRFNTLDDEGKPLPQTKFIDFWELLSDGRLSKKSKEDLDYFLYNYINNKKQNERKKLKGEEYDADPQFLNSWDAKSLKASLGLDLSIEQLSITTEEQMVELILQSKKKKKIYEPINHSKTLIIISGNIDQAFQMADQTSEADVDADIFHAFTKKITFVDIKNALSKKFRPEQVARFGNIHLIYKSLRKVDFEIIIEKEVNRIIEARKEKFNININIDSSIHKLIYANGVFPVQGVRPVFSTILDILETNLNQFVFYALMQNHNAIDLQYNTLLKQIEAIIGNEKQIIPYQGRLDKIRQSAKENLVANISVHESGHAVVYILLFKLAPLQLKSKIASSYAGGFTFPHDIHETRENLINKIKIYLAGGVAEEIIFGEGNASVGRSHDREQVTVLAADFIRRYGFDDEFQAVYSMDFYPYRMEMNATDVDIEKMIAKLVAETSELLVQHVDLLKEMSNSLAQKGSLETNEILNLVNKYNLPIEAREEGYFHIFDYAQKLK